MENFALGINIRQIKSAILIRSKIVNKTGILNNVKVSTIIILWVARGGSMHDDYQLWINPRNYKLSHFVLCLTER